MHPGDPITCINTVGTQHLTKGKEYICIWANEYEVCIRNDIQRETIFDLDRFEIAKAPSRTRVEVVAETLWNTNVKGTLNESVTWNQLPDHAKKPYRSMAQAMIALFGTELIS